MAIQATYRNTGLSLDDVIEAYAQGRLRTFQVRQRSDARSHIMLYPDEYPKVKIQVSNNTANIWSPSFDQLNKSEDLLNETFGYGSNSKPFKKCDILFNPGELRKIHETPLGLISAFAYYFRSTITDAVIELLDSMDDWDSRP